MPLKSVRVTVGITSTAKRAHDLLCAAVDAQVKGLATVDRVRRTAHVELVPWSRARRATTEPARMVAYPTR